MKQKIFILSYKGAKFLEQNKQTNQLRNTDIFIVDNGQQEWSVLKDKVIHTTLTNCGCAAGWNICADIGFRHFNQDKIVIANDDVFYTDTIVDQLFASANDTTICGAFDRSFEFSLFCLPKVVYEKIGRFEENCMFVADEDTDYKIRCARNNISVISLNKSANANLCLSSQQLTKEQRTANTEYVDAKWGKNRDYKIPFNTGIVEPITELKKLYEPTYGKIDIKWPSQYEFDRFVENNKVDLK